MNKFRGPVSIHYSSDNNRASQVAKTYTKALETINARKATANLHRLYANFAKFYEEGGVSAQAESDLDSARKILEKGTKVNFKAVEDLAEVWCEWSEMELRHERVSAYLCGVSTNITTCLVITMKPFASCKGQQRYPKTSRLTTMIMWVTFFFHKSISETYLNLDIFRASSLVQIPKNLVILCRP
jgi:hypothetical protein